jgi:hypothetical protein
VNLVEGNGMIENNVRVADQGEKVFVLDELDGALLVNYQGFTKWIPEGIVKK